MINNLVVVVTEDVVIKQVAVSELAYFKLPLYVMGGEHKLF